MSGERCQVRGVREEVNLVMYEYDLRVTVDEHGVDIVGAVVSLSNTCTR